MERNYLCPKCKGYLNVGQYVVFSVQNKDNKSGLLFLSPTLGDYTYAHHPDFTINVGDKLNFYCPICHTRLASRKHINLARILMVDESKEVYEVLFSEITGEQCTIQIMGDKFRVFGEHSQHYREFLEVMRKGLPFRNV